MNAWWKVTTHRDFGFGLYARAVDDVRGDSLYPSQPEYEGEVIDIYERSPCGTIEPPGYQVWHPNKGVAISEMMSHLRNKKAKAIIEVETIEDEISMLKQLKSREFGGVA